MYEIYDKGEYFSAENTLEEAKERISCLPSDFRIIGPNNEIIVDYSYNYER